MKKKEKEQGERIGNARRQGDEGRLKEVRGEREKGKKSAGNEERVI